MKYALIQNSVAVSYRQNLEKIAALADTVKDCDLIILPELCTTPYENEKIREDAPLANQSVSFFSNLARKKHAWLAAGTIPFLENGKIYNRMLLFDREGNLHASYDKTHLMEVHTSRSSYAEKDVFTPGNHFLSVQTPFGKLGFCICYDIRFPEVSRLLAIEGIQVLIVPAAFNQAVGKKHWEILMRTRALENEIFVLACNPAEYVWKGYRGYGHSMVCSPDGTILGQLDENEGVLQGEINLDEIEKILERMPFWKIRREDLYELQDAGE